MRALAVFTNGSGHPLGWMLKRGFRHCFVCVLSNESWLMVDGERGVPSVKYLTDSAFDLAAFYRNEGYTVVEMEQGSSPSRGIYAWNNCVGLVKAMLAVRSWAVTPYRLYRYLTKESR